MPTLRRGRIAALVVVIGALLCVAACSAGAGSSGGSASTGAGTSDKTLSVGFTTEPASLDFSKDDGVAIPQALLYNVYETLVKVDQKGKIAPSLAKSWKVSKDRKTYTFTLVKHAQFSNGHRFTAKDAVFSINRVKKDWTISLKSAMDRVKDATAVSPTKLRVTLNKPSNNWLYRMTTRIGAMMTKSAISSIAKEPVGTGPYKFKSWNRGDAITLGRNQDYWGKKPHYKRVTLKYVKDATALNNALRSDTIDVIGQEAAPESLKQFKDKSKYKIIEGATNGEVLLAFNNDRAPLKDRRVRRAIRYGIDHKALLDTCWAGRGKLIGSMVPPTDPWYEDLTAMYPHKVSKAKTLLKQAGRQHATLRLRLPTLPYAKTCGTVVKSQLEKLGLTVKMDQLEFPADWLKKVFTEADYDMSIIQQAEPRDMKAVFGDPDYYIGYDSKKLRRYLTRADQGTPKEQKVNMKKAARRISTDAASDFLYLSPNLIVAKKDVTGLPKNAVSESFDLSYLRR